MKLTKKQLAPLLESIEKWKQIERGEMPDIGTSTCSLCWSFYDDNCKDCPVRQSTGEIYCRDTPYWLWYKAADERHGTVYFDYGSHVADTPELVRLARAERKFLESLLPGKP